MRKALVILVTALWTCSLALAAAEAEKPRPKGEEEAARRIEEALKKKISFDFVETPIADALSFMQTMLDVNMVVSPKVDRAQPLTLKVNNMTVRNALEWMLKLVGAEMEIKNNAIFIRPGAGAPAATAHKPRATELERYRKGRMFGKAQIKLGGVATVELYLYQDALPAETRQMLFKLLHQALAAELEKQKTPTRK